MDKADVSLKCRDCYLKYMLAPDQYEELRDALYRSIRLAYDVLDDEWTGTEEQLRQYIMAKVGVDKETFDEAMK